MPVDPYLVPLLAQLPEIPEEVDWATHRPRANREGDELFAVVGQPGPDVAERREVTIPVSGGTVDLFVYRPSNDGEYPVHLFLHGGAFSMGSVRMGVIDTACRERCVDSGCVVVAVDYRKAPEHRFPTGLDDCCAALRWVVDHADTFGARADLLTVGGQSAGGNLAAALTLKVRDEGGPPIAFQLLEIPVLDLTFGQPSVVEFATGYGLTLRTLERMRRDYLATPGQATHPYASPLLAPDLSGLPPAHIMTAEYDPLRDEGAVYARRLVEAGVIATYAMHSGHIHGSGAFTQVMERARGWRAEVITTLRREHSKMPLPAARTSR